MESTFHYALQPMTHSGKYFLSCSGFSIRPTGTIPRALGMICRCLISLFDASKWRGTGGKLSHPGRESFPSLGGKVFPPVPST